MLIVDRVPDDRPLVVAPSRQYFVRFAVAGVSAVLGLAVVAVLTGYFATVFGGISGWFVGFVAAVGVVLLMAVVALLRLWRGSVGRGPTLAADTTGLWLRLDGGEVSRTRVVHLPWSEVERVGTRDSPPGFHQPLLCVYAPAMAAAAMTDPIIRRTTQRAVAAFGTPFVLSGRTVDIDLATIVTELGELAGSGIVDTARRDGQGSG
jgi:hypothetical protein